VALAVVTVWGTVVTEQATHTVQTINEVTEQWSQVFLDVSLEETALEDYLRASTNAAKDPLWYAVGSAEPRLDWLGAQGDEAESARVETFRAAYAAYTRTLRQLLSAGAKGDTRRVKLYGEQAPLAFSAVRKQVVAIISLQQLVLTAYLADVHDRNRTVRRTAALIFPLDLLLFLTCAGALVSYQRRIERQAARSEHRSLHDALTGLPNRVLLRRKTDAAVAAADAADANGDVVGFLLIDLDRFKDINDTLGHHHGDLLLKQIAGSVLGAVRGIDTVARLGGDEFAVLLPAVTSAVDALDVAARVLDAIRQTVELDGMTVDVDGSIGLSLYPTFSADADQLLKHADVAMYRAKRERMGITTYEHEIGGHHHPQLALQGELSRGIQHGELVLHYQPKVEADCGTVVGVEALVRWQHPDLGLLPRDAFIPLAEEGNLIERLTDQVLVLALDQCREWQSQGHVVPMAVNIAARCLLDQKFPAKVAAALAIRGLSADLLTLELTESAVVTAPARLHETLQALRGVGIRLSIDDFGAGFTSMAHLRTMPVEELKIDRIFMSGLGDGGPNDGIVQACIELARYLGLRAVAEGVEDAATWITLCGMGCHTIQGYYLSRPMPQSDFLPWLEQWVPRRPSAADRPVLA
jgi:diguanylate cyclase (GGDEF)-like protein